LDFKRGEILYDPNFIYPDGGKPCDKLLLVANKNHRSPDDVVIIPAKTNTNKTPYKPDCNPNQRIFYFEKQIGFYGAATIIQLYHIDTKLCGELERLIKKGRLDRLNKSATVEEFGRILNCLKAIARDIPGEIQDLIF